MPESTAHTTELTSQYISQVANDLDRNVKEQERVTEELAVLQEQSAALQRDHAVLVNMQQALGAPTTAPELARTDSAVVPSPRKKPAPASGARRPAKKAPAQEPQGKKTAETTAQPKLVDLIHQHVVKQSEPRSAVEIAEALRQAHTGRAIDTKVVRTTLENLVAKSRVHRTKQGSSVFYTAADAPGQEAASACEAQPETATA
ncbi:hypothetical protein ACIQVL_47270 [Streptomyces sp. NPDC090499]|uniref:hypothetical protein n=1 Tax=Streptomyces sp. NPDC090499 TaxID=3365965 RepID=UPI00382AF59C